MSNCLNRLILPALFLSVVIFSPHVQGQQLPLHLNGGYFAAPAPGGSLGQKTQFAAGKSISDASRSIKVGSNRPKYVPGEVLVKYKSTISMDSVTDLNRILGSTAVRRLGRTRVQQLKVRPGLSVEAAMVEYRNQPEVEYAQPNYIYSLQVNTPNDPDYSKLWGMNNTGQNVNGFTGTLDADIDGPEAWEITTGSPNVIVAVVDSGVDYNHPDLSANIWMNTDELIGNAVDDDGNGYVDDIRGWDFVDNDINPMDYNGHGTHVASTIGGVGNNASGIAGVAWTTKIMPLRVCDTVGSCTTANQVSGIDYAVDNGAKILNLSIGSQPGGPIDQALMDAIAAANTAGVLMVIAAGNDANNNDASGKHVYPSDYTYPNIISVAATTQTDSLAHFSNYGAVSVDVGAPGTNIYSLQPARETVLSEGFESSALGWTTATASGNPWGITDHTKNSGSHSLDDGSYAANYPANNDAAAISPTFSLAGKTGCSLTFWANIATEPDFDGVDALISTGGAYASLAGPFSGTTGGWVPVEFDLKPYEGNATVSLMFRLFADASLQYDGVQIDDIAVTCSSNVFVGTEYAHKDGTSMAAPHVAGLAALLLAQNPSRGLVQLKAAILDKGDAIPALTGKTVSGKRINAYKSLLDNIAPASPTVSINHGAASALTTNVTVTLSATDGIGVTGYYLSELPTTPTAGAFTAVIQNMSYFADVPFTLSGSEAIKTVYAWFRDSAGNISARVSDTIVYDQTAPGSPSISINSGAVSTDTRAVTLSLSAVDGVGVTGYYVSESSVTPVLGVFSVTASVAGYSAAVSFNLSSGYGTKRVNVWYKDEAGNISPMASDTIDYAAGVAPPAAPPASSSGGGGGGCSLSRDGSADPLLFLVFLASLIVIWRRSRRM